MTLNAIPDLPPAAAPSGVLPASALSTVLPAPPPAPALAFLTGHQLAAALGVSRRTLTTWNQRRVIPSVSVGRVRRYELAAVQEALRAHGRDDSASPSSSTSSSLGLDGSGGKSDVS